jgi:hypothetical protein
VSLHHGSYINNEIFSFLVLVAKIRESKVKSKKGTKKMVQVRSFGFSNQEGENYRKAKK